MCSSVAHASFEKVRNDLTILAVPIYGRYDSQVVLSWLKDYASTWNSLVACSFVKIHTELPAEHWNYVDFNPADQATREMTPSEFLISDVLFHHGYCKIKILGL